MDYKDTLSRAKIGDTDYFEGVELAEIEKAKDKRHGHSVLHHAVKHGHLSCCEVIHRRCPQLLYQTNIAGNTALHQAAYDGRHDIVEFLVTASAKLEQEENSIKNGGESELVDRKLVMMANDDKHTALHSAVRRGHLRSAKILINADPSKKLVRLVDKDSATAMHFSVKKHNLEIVKLLVDFDLDFEYPANSFGLTPLMMASEEAMSGNKKTEDIRKLLIEKQPAQYRQPTDSDKWSLIHYAASRGDFATVMETIYFWPGCSEWVDKDHLNFVHVAAKFGQVNLVKYVLQQQDTVTKNILNAKDRYGNTPLHLAMSSCEASVALALLDDPRVDKMVKNEDGKNPFKVVSKTLMKTLRKVAIQFARKGDVDFFRAIRVNLFEDSRDENGESVLSTAVAKGHLNCCEVILRRCEGLLFKTNKNGLSSFHIAVSNREEEILEFLLKYQPKEQRSGGNSRNESDIVYWKSRLQMVLEMTSDKKDTALHLAVGGGHHQSAKLLIEANSIEPAGGYVGVAPLRMFKRQPTPKVNMLAIKNLQGETAMHMAVKGHHLEIVKLLVEAHPDCIYSANDVGSIPVLIALQEAALGDPVTMEIRNFLISKQPKQCEVPTGVNNWILIHHAVHKGDLLAIKEIILSRRVCCRLTDSKNNNILHLAAKFNHFEVAKHIMTLGDIAKDLVNGKDMCGNTPSHVAKSCRNQGIADFLLNDHRFEKTSQNNDGEIALNMGPSVPFQYAKDGDLDFFRTIQVDVLLESENGDGDSLLSVAAKEGRLICCEVISKTCPEILYKTNKNGFSPLHMAAFNGKDEIVRLLIEADTTKEMLSMTDNHQETALHYAVKKHHLNIVELIVKADSNIEYSANALGDTPLLIALKEAHKSHDQTAVKIRSHLIEKQSSQICKTRTGPERQTLLQYAIALEDLVAIEEIIKSCVDCLLLVDDNGQNALHHAVSLGSVELVNSILGIKDISESVLNGKDKNGDTPLHLATAGKNVDISLSLLYDSRVRKTILNDKEKNALDKIDFVYDLSRAKVEGFPDLVDIKELKEQSDFDLLVGALISTVSFTSGITVPGGFFSDGPNRGNALLHKKRTFQAFVVFNTIALVLSLYVVFSHFCLRRLVSKKSILLQLQMATFSLIGAIFTMLLAFIMGSFAVLSISPGLSVAVCVICCCFFVVSGFSLLMTIGQKKKQRRSPQNQQSVQSPWNRVMSYICNW